MWETFLDARPELKDDEYDERDEDRVRKLRQFILRASYGTSDEYRAKVDSLILTYVPGALDGI